MTHPQPGPESDEEFLRRVADQGRQRPNPLVQFVLAADDGDLIAIVETLAWRLGVLPLEDLETALLKQRGGEPRRITRSVLELFGRVVQRLASILTPQSP